MIALSGRLLLACMLVLGNTLTPVLLASLPVLVPVLVLVLVRLMTVPEAMVW